MNDTKITTPEMAYSSLNLPPKKKRSYFYCAESSHQESSTHIVSVEKYLIIKITIIFATIICLHIDL